jgi:hypothetical protein
LQRRALLLPLAPPLKRTHPLRLVDDGVAAASNSISPAAAARRRGDQRKPPLLPLP